MYACRQMIKKIQIFQRDFTNMWQNENTSKVFFFYYFLVYFFNFHFSDKHYCIIMVWLFFFLFVVGKFSSLFLMSSVVSSNSKCVSLETFSDWTINNHERELTLRYIQEKSYSFLWNYIVCFYVYPVCFVLRRCFHPNSIFPWCLQKI